MRLQEYHPIAFRSISKTNSKYQIVKRKFHTADLPYICFNFLFVISEVFVSRPCQQDYPWHLLYVFSSCFYTHESCGLQMLKSTSLTSDTKTNAFAIIHCLHKFTCRPLDYKGKHSSTPSTKQRTNSSDEVADGP